MAQVKGIYGDGTESKKKKTTPASTGSMTGATTQPTTAQNTVTKTPAKKPKKKTVDVPAQSTNDAKQEQIRAQQYLKQQSAAGTSASTGNTTGSVAAQSVSSAWAQQNATPVQSYNDARQEQLAARKHYQAHSQPQMDSQELAYYNSAKKQAEEAWDEWVWKNDYNPNSTTQLEDFYRKAGIELPRGTSFHGKTPTVQQLYEAVQRGKAEAVSAEAARREQQARRARELEAFFEQMDREWYSDDPEWQKSHQDADSARAEQRAAREYLANRSAAEYTENKENDETKEDERNLWDRIREGFQELYEQNSHSVYDDLLAARSQRDAEEERREMAADSSTQAALEEKLAEKGYWNELAAKGYAKDNEAGVQSGVLYNEHTGEIFIPANKKNNETGRWETYSLDGKILVDPEVERRFGVLSNGISAVLTGTGAVVTKKPTVMMLQPIMATLVKAGLLEKKYEGKEYVLNNPHTNEIGISVSGAPGARLSGSVGIAADCYGNVGIVLSGGGGGGTPSASAGVYSTRTNASSIDYLRGASVKTGGSVSVGPTTAKMSAGIDVVGFYSSQTGETYYGTSTNIGVTLSGLAPIKAEMHGEISGTLVINMKELWEKLNSE